MKPFYMSKTFWVNVLALAAMVCQERFGWLVEPETQAGVLAIINLLLRLVTREAVTWSSETARVLLVVGLAGMVTGCAGVQVCREAAIVLRDASEPDQVSLAVECDGTTVVRLETEEVVTPTGARLRSGRWR